ncbi:hypothetical protein NFL61_22830 (plasmid) [Enterobacter ludwigii]|uniref:hypothetical protein n=1 Tax=Enterobacter ludwigii TaxID=299767 RepID=UPI00242D8734|nr:hypothetical protein [Enterobacter ludwigii]WGC22743.1 hypothetical protein NFL61_22830 [Enterobacter ludwigii]
MRDEKRNNNLLRNMRMHIAEWEAGRPTPAGSRFMFIWFVSFTGIVVVTVSEFRPSLLAMSLLVVWFFLSQMICRRIVPRYNESWEEVFDRALSAYEPLNLSAWEHLKHQAEQEGLTLSIVSSWYQEETRSVWPEKKPDLKFLHKTSDRSVKTGEE